MAQYDLLPCIVDPGAEAESASLLTAGNRPAGQCAGDIDHILLGVAPIHTKCVQLEELAAVILVEAGCAPARRWGSVPVGIGAGQHTAAPRPGFQRRLGAVRDAFPIVEIEQHRRTLGHRTEEVTELSERVRADDIAIEAPQVIPHLGAFAVVDRKVIEPEIGHHLLELTAAHLGTRDAKSLNVLQDPVGGAPGIADRDAVRRGHWCAIRVGRRAQPGGDLVRLRDGALELGDRLLVAGELGDEGVRLPIVDRLRVQLARDPPVDAHLTNGRGLPRPCPERQPVEDLQHLLVCRQLPAGIGRGRQRSKGRPRVPAARSTAGDRERDQGREQE